MTGALNWFLDFDETLATGSLTWALEFAFPRLIRQYDLSYDEIRFHEAVLVAQERTNRDVPAHVVVTDLFETMGWPHELERPLFDDVLTNYQPQLFDDALPFLERLRAANKRVFVISNNRLSMELITILEIEGYVSGVYTYHHYEGAQPKPHRSLWDVVLAADSQVGVENSVFVGDDPWSDGSFADNSGIPCWIVDRRARFTKDYERGKYRWVRSLGEIPVD